MKEAKSINLSLHYLEQVIISLREQAATVQAQQQLGGAGGSSAYTVNSTKFIPYRNSVLTSMLRDSLGGNCRSCFLINISVQRLHFEESVASCRFGQRCGEVKVRVVANTEVGLSDQLRELTIRVRALDRQLSASEEQRRVLEMALEGERQQRRQQTELRILSAEEQQSCRDCVHQLLSRAKNFLPGASAGDTADFPALESGRSAGTWRRTGSSNLHLVDGVAAVSANLSGAGELIEQSQEALFQSVERMDRAVLLELGIALGGLVQSLYLDREEGRRASAAKEKQLCDRDEALRRAADAEERLDAVLCHGDERALAALTQLPRGKSEMVRKGAVFVKHSWLGKKSVRFVSVSADSKSLCLQHLGRLGGKIGAGECTVLPLSSMER